MKKINKKCGLYLAVIIFLIINLGAVFFSWQGRDQPPEPDDANLFIGFFKIYTDYQSVFSPKIKIFDRPYFWNQYGGADRTTYFSWAFFWGNIAKITSLDIKTVLVLSYYFGVILFLFSVLYFFKEKDLLFKSILVLVTAFFTGDGSYHGLFWPTASLYSISLFLIIFKLALAGKKNWFLYTLSLFPLFFLCHPLGMASLITLPFFILIDYLFLKIKDFKLWKRLIVLLVLGLGFYFSWFKFLSLKNISLLENTNVFKTVLLKFLKGELVFSKHSIEMVLDKYVIYILTRPFLLTLFVLGIIKSYKKDKKILSIYLSFLSLIFIAFFVTGGERVLLPIWVLTFFILTHGMVYLFELLKKLINNKLENKDKKIFLLLLLTNIVFQAFFVFFIFKTDSSKNIVLKKYLIVSQIAYMVLIMNCLIFKRKLILYLSVFGLINFFTFLGLEKAAMVVFLNQKDNFTFNADLVKKINPLKKGIIIYNDNLSFATFSSQGLLDREVVKKGYLRNDDLKKAAYFIAFKNKLKDCQEESCWYKEGKKAREMKRIAFDDSFIIFEF